MCIRDSFGPDDEAVLALLARMASVALERASLYETLRSNEQRLTVLVESSPLAIAELNLDGTVRWWNRAAGYLFGWDESGLAPRAIPVAGEAASMLDSLWDRARLGMATVGALVPARRPGGELMELSLSVAPLEENDGSTGGILAVAEDATEREQVLEQFHRAQRLGAMARLAGGIAHDFNNLLMVVSGYTEVLLDQLTLGHPLHAKAEAIQQASDRATTLTRQLLAFSRKQLLELKVIDVNAIVTDMERLLRPLIGEHIQLTTSLAPAVGCTRADAGQLEQVIMNLVVNAKDAMPSGGEICIRTASVTLDDSYRPENTFIKNGPYVMISVSDNGHGMDRETQARIFEPFFTTKEKGKGTGLGLSTVYGIIKQSGGYVFVQSELDRGTVFTIYFPRVDEASEARGDIPVSLAAAGGTETVLLVEDEDSVRQLVRETLESRGYRVFEAANGQAALAFATTHPDPIHLIITDVVMPGLNGHELIQQLLPARPGIKVLYLSGYAQDAFSAPLSAEAQKTFLQKPFTLQSLTRKVREILGPPAN